MVVRCGTEESVPVFLAENADVIYLFWDRDGLLKSGFVNDSGRSAKDNRLEGIFGIGKGAAAMPERTEGL